MNLLQKQRYAMVCFDSAKFLADSTTQSDMRVAKTCKDINECLRYSMIAYCENKGSIVTGSIPELHHAVEALGLTIDSTLMDKINAWENVEIGKDADPQDIFLALLICEDILKSLHYSINGIIA